MLRMYLLQCWFNLSDEGVEDAIYDSYAMRKFMGINFFEQDVPDATTLLHFRHLLEEHGLGKLFFDTISRCLERAGRMMRGGSIVDATLINAPSSTKNAEKKRDPEMHQTKKGNQWHFGMKCHTGVDAGSGFVHTVEATAAQAGCSRFPAMRSTGSGTSRTQIRCTLQGGAPLPNCEEYLRVPKDGLPRTAEKSQPIARALCQCEPVYACQGGRLPTPRLGFLRPFGQVEEEKWGGAPNTGLYFAFLHPIPIVYAFESGFNQRFPKYRQQTKTVPTERTVF